MRGSGLRFSLEVSKGRTINGSGERVHPGLILVHPRAQSMPQ